VYWLIIVWLPRVVGAGVSVNGSALVFCGRHMWFLGGRNVCAIFLCTYSFVVLIHWINTTKLRITHTYGCRLQLKLLRMGAIAPETCRAKK
jgi:hypothetical protein